MLLSLDGLAFFSQSETVLGELHSSYSQTFGGCFFEFLELRRALGQASVGSSNSF